MDVQINDVTFVDCHFYTLYGWADQSIEELFLCVRFCRKTGLFLNFQIPCKKEAKSGFSVTESDQEEIENDSLFLQMELSLQWTIGVNDPPSDVYSKAND